MVSFSVGAFSQRETVGCEHKSVPVSGSRPQASLNAGSERRKSKSLAVLVAAGDRQPARSQHILDRVRDVRGIARIGNQSGERSGEGAPPLGKGEQHDAAVRGKPAAIERGCDFLARHRWQGEGGRGIFGHDGCGRAA